MIPIIITLIKTKLSSVLQFIRKYNKLLAMFIILIFVAIFVYLRNTLIQKDKELARVTNNYKYYEYLATCKDADNRVLQLDLRDYQNANDSLIKEMKTILKKLNIKDKSITQVQRQLQDIRLDTTIIIKECEFVLLIKPNELTIITISKKDSILNAKLEINNVLTLFLSSKKEYRHLYKNWFGRLLHFDFKKDLTYKYTIHNSNDLIKISNTRLVEISD